MSARTSYLSTKTTPEIKELLEKLAVRLTTKSGRRYTLTSALEESIREKCSKERVK